MNVGIAVLGLGVLGVLIGAGMFAAKYHRTIGLGGLVIGIILVLIGIWMARGTKPKVETQPSQTTPQT